MKVGKKFSFSFLGLLFGLNLSSCDPEVQMSYVIVNQSYGDVYVTYTDIHTWDTLQNIVQHDSSHLLGIYEGLGTTHIYQEHNDSLPFQIISMTKDSLINHKNIQALSSWEFKYKDKKTKKGGTYYLYVKDADFN